MNTRSGLILLALAGAAHAAQLQQETITAWQKYLDSATTRMQERLRPESHFLKLDENQDWIESVRSGDVLVFPNHAGGLTKVPGGLIHDWLGDVFIPRVTLDKVLSTVRDYDRYKYFYQPAVVKSTALSTNERDDRFSMVLMNKSFFAKTALDSDYKSRYVRVDDRRWYSISETIRIQEIKNYGAPDQRILDENEGDGLLWRIFTITRFEERDGGVYVELEAIALSRDIPMSLRWIVEPIVRRISKESLTTSLRQTKDVVGANVTIAGCNSPGLCSARSDAPTASNSALTRSFR